MASESVPGTSLLKPIVLDDANDESQREDADAVEDFLDILRKKGTGAKLQKYKNYALILHYNSPKTYLKLKNHFDLPSIKDLDNIQVNFDFGINEKVLHYTKTEIFNLPVGSNNCILILQKVPLKPYLYHDDINGKILGFCDFKDDKYLFADYAVVMMLKGIITEWNQVIGCTLASSAQKDTDFADYIRDVVKKLFEFNFQVRAVLTDTTLAKKVKPLVQTLEQPYFQVFRNKVCLMFDGKELLKNIGITFKSENITFKQGKQAKWEHIVNFYETDYGLTKSVCTDGNEIIRLAPQLTKEHLDVDENIDSSLVADIFSHPVAVGLLSHVRSKFLPNTARDTVYFLIEIRKIFDLLDGKPEHKGTFRDVAITSKYMDFLKTITNGNCFELLILSINSHLQVFRDINNIPNIDLKSYSFRNFNIEPVNKFIQFLKNEPAVLGQSDFRSENFIYAYGKAMLKYLAQKPSVIEEELLAFMQFNEKLKHVASMNVLVQKPPQPLHEQKNIDFEKLESTPLVYISGCVYKKYIETGLCEHTKVAKSTDPPAFITYVINLDSKFTRYLYECMTQSDCIVTALLHKLSPVAPLQAECCQLFPQHLVVKNFIQLRLIHVIQTVNKNHSFDGSLSVSIKGLNF